MNMSQNLNNEPDFKAIKEKQKVIWASGDYARVGATLQIVGENLAEAMDVRADQKILDVAAGNGNFTLAAARRWARAQVSRSEATASVERSSWWAISCRDSIRA